MTKEKNIKIIYMGTPDFAVLPLKALIEHPAFEVQAVVTQLDKKVGRKQEITPPPIKILAQKGNITILQPEKINDIKFINLIKSIKPDFIVVAAFGKILPKEVLDIPKYCSINIHASLLPNYRGASPIQECLLNGDNETGVSLIRMNEKLDAGNIYLMQRIQIEHADNAETLSVKLATLGAILLPFTLIDIAEGNLREIPQNHENATYCKKITKEDGQIDFKKETAEQILNKIRAFTPWPNCYTFLGDKQFKIIEAETRKGKALPGKIAFPNTKEIEIGTKKDLIIPKKVQIEGKKETSMEEFLKGYTEVLRSKKSFTSKK